MSTNNKLKLPISEYQKRFFLEWVLSPDESTYNVSSVYKICGKLNKTIFKKACELFISQHEVVHARYNEDGSECFYANYHIDDFYHENTLDATYDIQLQLRQVLDQPFNLTQDVLLKFYLLSISNKDDEHYFVHNAHHIICDGEMHNIIPKDLSTFYNQLLLSSQNAKVDISLTFESVTFTQAVTNETYMLTSVYNTQAKEYWLKLISDIPLVVPLPYKPGISIQQIATKFGDKRSENIYFELTGEIVKNLNIYARKNKSTLFIVLSALYGIVLSRYINQEKLLFSYPVNLRPKGFSHVSGCFVNNLPLILELDKYTTLDDLIIGLTQQRKNSKLHQGYSFTNIISDQRLQNGINLENYFNVQFAETNLNALNLLSLNGLDIKEVDIPWSNNAISDICLHYDATVTDRIKFKLDYKSTLLDSQTVAAFKQSFREILNVSFDNIILKDYNALSTADYKKIIYNWNHTGMPYPEDKTIHQLFEEQVKRTPDNIAIVYERTGLDINDNQANIANTEISLTYAELNLRANQLAHHLRDKYDIRGDDLVALSLDRSEHMLIAILGVLKSGAAYVPMDPNYPDERITYILEDTQAKVVVTNEIHQEQLSAIINTACSSTQTTTVIKNVTTNTNRIDLLSIDSLVIQQLLDSQPTTNLKSNIKSTNLVYVIYTSGSTGKPKGVMVEHKNVVNLITGLRTKYNIKDDEKFVLFANYVFDASVAHIGLALLLGHTLYIISNDLIQNVDAFGDFIFNKNITHLEATSSYLENLDHNKLSRLKRLAAGGEILPKNLYDKLSKTVGLVANEYGPTEASVTSLIAINSINIGQPINNTTAYILDANLNPLPVMVIGELYIGGAGVTRGYLNQPELTRERFIANPFQSAKDKHYGNKNARLYKTGDLVRYLPDGNIEYIGRNDSQVKIRGFRIEINEIENAIARLEGIKQSCVIVKERTTNSDSKYLTGYYVLDNEYVVDNDTDILADWEHVYDIDYSNNLMRYDPTIADFSGWDSFITSKPIPIQEMQEWLDATVNTIKALKPHTILEIGVGSGLVMYPLLGTVKTYVGLDLSSAAIECHHKYLQHSKHKVDLYHLAADKVDTIYPNQSFDCIILNSVAQYFPSISYFTDVVVKALAKLSPGGSLFIGDVRNYNLHRALVQDKLLYEQVEYTESEVKYLMNKENELLIAPEYFSVLGQQLHNFKVVILEKSGNYSNELSKYRYDVILTARGSNATIINSENILLQLKMFRYYNTPFLNKLTATQILSKLSKELPDYMLPSHLVEVDTLPLTINGKLDRNALPEPEFIDKDNYIAPRSKLEIKIRAIYAEVLGLTAEQVGIGDDFFRLGGDSIISIQLASRLRQRLGLNVSVKDIFNNKTIEKLYNLFGKIGEDKTGNWNEIVISESGILSNEVKLLPIQEWFFSNLREKFFTKPGHWNQSFLVRTKKLDQELLSSSVAKLVEYHDAFRLNYKEIFDGDYTQYYTSPCPDTIKINYLNLTSLANDPTQTESYLYENLTKLQSKFNLFGNAPLYSIAYIDGYPDGSSRVFFALHHLLIDAVSWRIIAYDLGQIYNRLEEIKNNRLNKSATSNVEDLLGAKGTSYRQWVEIVNNYAKSHVDEKHYWTEQILNSANAQTVLLELIESESIRNLSSLSLDKPTTELLLTKANQAYHTEINDLLLSAFGLALAKTTHQSTNYIMLEGHGREEIVKNIDITRTVGWFTSMYPVSLTVNNTDIGKSIITVKEHLRKIPHKGVGFGALFGYTEYNLPRISFNYLGQFNSAGTNSFWEVVGEASGKSVNLDNHDTNIIDVNGAIDNGQLFFNISAKLSEEKLLIFVDEFKKQLINVVQHTTGLKRSYLSVSDINYVISQAYLDRLQADREIEGVYLANSLQQGFIYHALNYGNKDTSYRVQLMYDYKTNLDPDIFKLAWEGAIKHYASLRLRFAWEEELIQIIDKTQNLIWHYTDISKLNLTAEDQKKFVQLKMREDHNLSYNLAQGNLFRIYLFKHDIQYYTCAVSNHHINFDGWSGPQLINFVHDLYMQLYKYRENQTILNSVLNNITPENIYASSQYYLQNHNLDSKPYWEQQLSKIEEFADFSSLFKLEYKGIILSDYRLIQDHGEKGLTLNTETKHKLIQISRKYGITLNTILQYVWHKVLSIYGNVKTTIVGTIISGRNLPIDGIENSVGLYINTLPLIIKHNDQNTILIGLENIQEQINGLNSQSNINLAKLQTNGNRLFDSLFVYQNYPVEKHNPLQATLYSAVQDIDYPLGIMVHEQDNQIHISLKYARELFNEESILQLLDTYEILIDDILTDNITKRTQGNHNYLTPVEYAKVFTSWNQTVHDYSDNKTIHELFEEQVERTPNSIALVCNGNVEFTYAELNRRANQLSHYLSNTYQIKCDDLIILCLERDVHMLVTIFAVLKSGAAYVPIDDTYPEERIAYILADTKAKILISNKIHTARLNTIIVKHQYSVPIMHQLSVDSQAIQTQLKSMITTNPPINIKSSNLAYVVYTSGTTGKPKGVMIEHKSVVNLVTEFIVTHKLRHYNEVSIYSNYVFDAFVYEAIPAIVNGNKLYLLGQKERLSLEKLEIFIRVNQIKISFIPTSLLVAFLHILKVHNNKSLKVIYTGGEKFPQLDNNYLNENLVIFNEYGPTEATVCATLSRYTQGINTNIGKPINNTVAYILDVNLAPLPIGVTGELYLGGTGLARGYLNQPELTAEKFIANPFQTEIEKQQNQNLRLYKTGDLARYLTNGDIEYIGRNDSQIKIRGMRIELGEIERILLNYPGIQHAAAIVQEYDIDHTDRKYIAAYYVAQNTYDETLIMEYLSKYLPEYMLPTSLVWLDKLPLTINGKLDRKALAGNFKRNAPISYTAPENSIEDQLCTIFAETLRIPKTYRVSITDDFFKLGGNSILAIKVVYEINRLMSCNLSITNLLHLRTVKKLAQHFYSFKLYRPIIMLTTQSNNKLNMFMIHPGHGGCEVYFNLARFLENQYNCYGIDNYNIHNTNKINTIEAIANQYINYITEIQPDGAYNLLGWSLGGQIALEIARLLEAKKHTVNLYLLDTFLPAKVNYDEVIQQPSLNKNLFITNAMNVLTQSVLETNYIEKVRIALPSEYDIFMGGISGSLHLRSTKIKLFKAIANDNINTSNDNNLGFYVLIPFKVILVKCDHYHILETIITDKQLLAEF